VSASREQVAASIQRAQADLEQALADLDKLPAVDGRSTALAAHALSNFLTVSGAVVEGLLLSLRDHPEPQVRIWLEGLRHATSLMTHTVSQLMNNSTVVEPSLRFEAVDLSRLAQRACAYYQPAADGKGLRITFGASPDVPLVWTDRVAVAAVLDNLLSNAVKYSPRGRAIRVRVEGEPASAVCSVGDEGPGLSPENQARLFEPGARLGSVPSGGEPSTGYGLAVAKRLIDRLGGEIWCVSRLGQGTTFAVRLPAHGEGVHDAGRGLPGSGGGSDQGR
jgi:signal transduction histidine kinase